jgi:hypothetical protein
MKEYKKLCFAFIGISLCLIILYFLSKYNDNSLKESFVTLSPVTYSETTITDYNNYQNKLVEDAKAAGKTHNVISVDDLQKLGVPETDVKTFISSGIWPWTAGFTDALKKMLINSPNTDSTTITTTINDAQKQFPEQFYITFFNAFYDLGFASIAKTKNIGCNIDPVTKKATGDTMFTLDNNGQVTTTPVANDQLPTLIPGFTFLNQPCNPCNIYNRNFDCPFAYPDESGKTLFPGFVMEYAWDNNNNNTATTAVNNSINSISSSISSLF